MTTSQRLAASVWRIKPVACGNQVYSTGSLSSAATMSAILFSKPSAFSLENGRLAGSEQTRRAVRLTRSTRCASAHRADARNETPSSALISSDGALLLITQACLLVLVGRFGLLDPLGRPPARQDAVGARLQIHVDI